VVDAATVVAVITSVCQRAIHARALTAPVVPVVVMSAAVARAVAAVKPTTRGGRLVVQHIHGRLVVVIVRVLAALLDRPLLVVVRGVAAASTRVVATAARAVAAVTTR
jgi:hypothetical protein